MSAPAAAQLLTSAQPRTAEWFAARMRGVTATDCAKICAPNQWGNTLTVWHEKTAASVRFADAQPPAEAAQWGNLLEPVVAEEWARRNFVKVRRVGVLANKAEPWMIASLDRLVSGCTQGSTSSARCALEVKTRSAYVASRFREGIPDDVLAQVQWQIVVGGLDHVHVAILLGGQRLVEHVERRDDALCAHLMRECAELWDSVQRGAPPEAPLDQATVGLFDRLFFDRQGVFELPLEEAANLWLQAENISVAEKSVTKQKTRYKARILELLQGAEELTSPLGSWTYRPQDRTSIDLVAAKKADLWVALSAAGAVKTTTSRVLRAHKAKGQ